MKNDEEKKAVFDNLEKTKRGIPISKATKDYFSQTYQLHRVYYDHKERIKNTLDNYGVDMNRLGPIQHILTDAQVAKAHEITQNIKGNSKLRKIAYRCDFPIRSKFYASDDKDEIIDGTIFLFVLRLMTKFCYSYSIEQFQTLLENGSSSSYIEKLFTIPGETIIETEEAFDKLTDKIIKEMKEK